MGALIGGTFGGVFVLANANTPLGDGVAVAFRILAACGLLALYQSAGRHRRRRRAGSAGGGARRPNVNLFGRRYWLIVAGELALLAIGVGALRAMGAPQQANVAWIALIVGLHFIAFRFTGVWGHSLIAPAGLLILFGLAGLGLAASSDPGWTSVVSGVLSGFTLLVGSIYVIARGLLEHRTGSRAASARDRRPIRRSDPTQVR